MLESFEAVIDTDSNIRILTPVELAPGRRAIVVLLEEDYVKQPPRKSDTIEVHFVHPRNASALTVDISPQCTGVEALQELQSDGGIGAFILPSQRDEFYGLTLSRTGNDIHPDMTFTQAGVVDGDEIQIRLGGIGGGPGSAEIIQIVFTSAAVLLAFLNALRPIILKLLEAKFRIVFREDIVEIEGDGIRSTNKIIKILEAIVKTKGLSLQEIKDETAHPRSANVFRLKPAVHKKDREASKRRTRSRASLASKTTGSSDSGNKVARRKESAKKSPS